MTNEIEILNEILKINSALLVWLELGIGVLLCVIFAITFRH